MKQSDLFGTSKNTKPKREIALIVGNNVTNLILPDLMHIIGDMYFIDIGNVDCWDTTKCLAQFNANDSLDEVLDNLDKNNLIVSLIINTPTALDIHGTEEEQPAIWSLVDKKYLGTVLTIDCAIVDIYEPVRSSEPLISTSRTPSGIPIRGKSNYDLTKAGFRIATIFYYDNDAIASRSLLPRGFYIAKQHFAINHIKLRSLSLMVSPFEVLEVFGDGQMAPYILPEEN